MDERWDRVNFVRDKCLTGDPYKCNVRRFSTADANIYRLYIKSTNRCELIDVNKTPNDHSIKKIH